MFTHTRSAFAGLLALGLSTIPTLGDDLPDRLTTVGVQPAFVGANLKQEMVSATCAKFASDGSFWTCYGYGTASPSTKAFLVTHVGCRSYAYASAVNHTQVDLRRGSTAANRTDYLTFGLTKTLALPGFVFQSANLPMEFVVPAGQRAHVDGTVIGTGISSATLTCTFTGRLATP